MVQAARTLLSLLAILLLAYGALRAVEFVHYSGATAGGAVSGPFVVGPAATLVDDGRLGLHATVTARVERLELAHAPRNILYFLGLGALAALWLSNSLVLGVGLLWQAAGDRSLAMGGLGLLFATILAPAVVVLAMLFALSVYILALGQPCSPAYALVAWPLGLLALLLGMGLGLRVQEGLIVALTGWRPRSRLSGPLRPA